MPSISLDSQPRNIGVARRFVFDALAEVPVDRHLASLLVSELVTNVILHAGTTFEVVVGIHAGDKVRVEVRDGAAVTEAFRELVASPPHQVDPGALSGRGMMLLSRLASSFGLDDRGHAGKAVWFELPVVRGAD